ncbi:MAG: phospholipase D family protein [Phycisphaeraceae bacterium]|nr:phospholipase D family protein [Phycisphaeraceae bacterium]
MSVTRVNARESATRLLSTPKDLQVAFLACLGWAEDVYIGTAWARPGWAILELAARHSRVHAVVGLSFQMTDPDALASLAAIGNDTWVSERDTPLFHSKFYLFRSRERTEAIVGSANLTNAAFLSNVECALHVKLSAQESRSWIEVWEGWRNDSTKVTAQWLASYRESWNPPTQGPLRKLADAEDLAGRGSVRNAPGIATPEILAASWPTYERILLRAAIRGTENWLADDQLGYRAALRELRQVASGPLPPAGSVEFQMIVGRKSKRTPVDHGWLGHFQGSGLAQSKLGQDAHLRRDLNALLRLLRGTSMRDDVANEQAAKRIWERVCQEHGLSHAVATRLLTLTRPERFFSVNGKSDRGVANAFDVSMSSLKSWDGYSKALRRLWSSPWFRSAPPSDPLSRELWDARVALIDALVYEHDA